MIPLKSKSDDFGLSDKAWQELELIFKSFHSLEKVILFGSRAKGTHKMGSDVDLAIQGCEVDTSVLLRLQGALEASSLPYFFDVIQLDKIDSPELLEHIRECGVVIYEERI